MADWGPGWSPDGSLIAWNSAPPFEDLHGFVMRPDGSSVEQVTDEIFFEYPSWSPDGDHIAFMSPVAEEGLQYDIFVMNADGTGIRRLTDSPGDEGWPSWSPNGDTILFSSQRDDCSFSDAPDCLTMPSGSFGQFHTLYLMNPDGSEERRVSDVFGQIADWSPDGRYILFEDFAGGGSGLNVMRVDGSGLATIAIRHPYPTFPDWVA